MKNITKLSAAIGALVLLAGCATIGADRNADGTYRPPAQLPGSNTENRVDTLKPQVPTAEGPGYTRPESVRPERSDDLLGGR